MNTTQKMLTIFKQIASSLAIAALVLIFIWALKEFGEVRYRLVNKAKIKQSQEQLEALCKAIEEYKEQNGSFPPENKHRLAEFIAPVKGVDIVVRQDQFVDPWGRNYYYHLSSRLGLGSYPDRESQGQPFYLWSYGPDGRDDDWGKDTSQPANRDNITNWNTQTDKAN